MEYDLKFCFDYWKSTQLPHGESTTQPLVSVRITPSPPAWVSECLDTPITIGREPTSGRGRSIPPRTCIHGCIPMHQALEGECRACFLTSLFYQTIVDCKGDSELWKLKAFRHFLRFQTLRAVWSTTPLTPDTGVDVSSKEGNIYTREYEDVGFRMEHLTWSKPPQTWRHKRNRWFKSSSIDV